MNPTASVISAITWDTQVQESAAYYSTCQGINPLHQELSKSYLARDYLGTAINIELRDGVCRDDPNLIIAMRALSNMHVHYEWIADELNCDQLHQIWATIFEKSLCTLTISGIFWVWISQVIALVSLFLVSISSSVMMLYFNNYWDISATVEFKLDNVNKAALLERYGDQNYSIIEPPFGTIDDSTESGSILVEETAPKEYIPVSNQVPFQKR